MQNVGQSENRNIDKVNVQLDVVKSSTPQSSASSPAKSETETYSEAPAKYMTDSSDSEDDSVSEVEMDEEGGGAESSKFMLTHDDLERVADPEMQARLEALLEAAGIGKLSGEGKHLADPAVLRRLTSSVSCALDEAAAALTRMRSDQPAHHRHTHQDKPTQCGSTATGTTGQSSVGADGAPSLAEACSDGDVGTVRKLLTEGRSVHETTEEGESLLSLACSAGYYELAQVLLAMHASVEDRGIKGDCTPLMEAASAGHVDIVRLLVLHRADVNAVSGSGNTPLMYACAGGHEDCVRLLLESGANVEDHNENGHTPLMEAASAGHVGVAKILLEHGAGINTHSNEFKESALTLACYKGHLDMVRFLLAAGADREHKTDEMHTALMEASMDGHVEVAKLLLDSGAQVNMPTDSFESPLTLAACGGHVDLALLLLERGANIEEVNDEGYTPLMEAAREGHEQMVGLLLSQGASINAQTEETQETALTLACCGGFLDVAEFLIKAGADIELGASTPLMEASQEGHLELVRYLVSVGADVHGRTQTGDTALTYACENGHTDVAELLLRAGAALEHESEGGRTPLMKACRAGHVCTVQFLVGKGADVNRMTANGDHTPLSLACAGGHADVVKFLLACDADPFRKLKDNSSTLIEAAKGGHTAVVQLLLDYPHSVMMARGACEDANGLTAAQAAQLGLSHVGAPGAPTQRTLVPAPAPGPAPAPIAAPVAAAPPAADRFLYVDPRKKGAGGGGAGATVTAGGGGGAAGVGVTSVKHKCARKLRSVQPQQDHHLPPPPDIGDDQRPESLATAQQRNEPLPETERNILELAEATGPPTLATSALHALDLQFCARGVSTMPTTPPYPPPQPFPTQPIAATVNQQQLQQQQVQQHLQQQQYDLQQQVCQPDGFAQQSGDTAGAGAAAAAGGARELGAVLAYLQREVPSLVALPLHELRALVLQVMQQKSHEILTAKCGTTLGGGAGTTTPGCGAACGADCELEERQARRLLAAAEEALSADWPALRDPHTPCQHRIRPSSPAMLGSSLALPKIEPETPSEQPPPVTEEFRSGTFTPPLAPPAPTVAKRDAPHQAAPLPVKKKIKGRPSTRPSRTPHTPHAPQAAPAAYCAMDVDAETDSNHDTALTLACAGGHDELVELLLSRGADMEHRDKKGFTPLILAATAGHEKIVEILLNYGADIEAQSERTKDTPLSLACSGGRYEVVELILNRGANKEHRNVSDYTPLSLAASGGYVNIIRLLLHHQAEINSRTGSKLGISPLMLAAMNGHTTAVRLLLDCGSDINAQIETNRNTALTLACFQGRHEVVSLLLDRKANVEHRAKTGLTPLMEAASGGYVEVGRVLLDKGADVNAPAVPSSRDTALTIAADKGHTKFVELLLQRRAAVEVKNKKGNSPLWLAANGGHLAVVEMLYAAGADIDSQDNRKVSCLMAAFRKGHTKVVKWMVGVVTQFPSDQEMTRYICTISDKELLEKCQECVRVIRAAKETQAARANQNATILLEELDAERCREENRRQAAARRRERKKKKKMEKKEERRKLQEENDKNSECCEKSGEISEGGDGEEEPVPKEEGDSGIDANSQGSCSSSDVKAPPTSTNKSKKKKKDEKVTPQPPPVATKKQPDKVKPKLEAKPEKELTQKPDKKQEKENVAPIEPSPTKSAPVPERRPEKRDKWETDNKSTSPKSATVINRREEGWKEVVRKSSVQTISTVEPGCKRVSVGAHAISRVIGRAGSNINAIRAATGAHIEVDKQGKGQGERIITIKGSAEATKQAATLIAAMTRDPDADLTTLLPRTRPVSVAVTSTVVVSSSPAPASAVKVKVTPVKTTASPLPAPRAAPRTSAKSHVVVRGPARVVAPSSTPQSLDKRSPVGTNCRSYTNAVAARNTFAAKLTAASSVSQQPPSRESPPVEEPRVPHVPHMTHVTQMSPESTSSWSTNEESIPNPTAALHINTTPQPSGSGSSTQEYSLFKDLNASGAAVWAAGDCEPPPPQQVDASKAPGYRGTAPGGCSPSSRAPSHPATPPPYCVTSRGNNVNTMDMSGMARNGPIYQDNSRNGHNILVSMGGGVPLGLGYVGVESRLNPRAPDFAQRPQVMHHKHNNQLFGATSGVGGVSGVSAGTTGGAGLSTLLLSYQQQQQPHKMHYQPSMLERSPGGVSGVGPGGSSLAPGWCEEEERKPRPIGTERAWKLAAPDDWHHPAMEHERYQASNAAAAAAAPGEVNATAAALSLMHALPLQYLPPAPEPVWDQQHVRDTQTWSKWTH